MKELKLQKALIALCLALGTTLKISNATNAMINKDEQIEQNPENKDLTQQENLTDTFSYKLIKYLKKKNQQPLYYTTPDQEYTQHYTIQDQEYIQLLNSHINNDIAKYLALLIQTKHRQLPIYTDIHVLNLTSPVKIFYDLYRNQIGHTREGQIITDETQKPQILQILQTIRDTKNKFDTERTNEEKILCLLFTDESLLQEIETTIQQMEEILNDYKKEERVTTTQKQFFLISFLDKVVEQLTKEHLYLKQEPLYQKANHKNNKLDQIVHIMKDFSDTCKTKLKIRHNRPKNTENTVLNKLKTYKKNNRLKKKLNPNQITEFLKDYISDDITKYLALMIQANYNQLPENKAKNGDILIESSDIYFLLNKDPKKILTDAQILKGERAKSQISNILYFFIHKLRKTNTHGGNILYLLFTPGRERYSQPEVLNKIQKYINAYKQEEENTVDTNYAYILSILGPIADQLDNDNYIQQPDEPNSILGQLAQLVREFSEAYKSKQNNKNKLNHPTRKLKLTVSSDLSGSSNKQEASNNAENSRTHNNDKQYSNKGNEKKGEDEEAEEMIHSVNQNQTLDEISKNQQGKANLAQILEGSTANNQNGQNQTTLKSNLTKIGNNKDNKETTKEKNEEAQSNHHSTTKAKKDFPKELQEPLPQLSYVGGDNKSIKQYATYTQAILAYTRDIKDKTKSLTDEQHIDFLSQYIDNRLITYLALLIQTRYKQVPQLEIQNENPEQTASRQYNLLRTELKRNQTPWKILPNNKPSELIIQSQQQLDIIESIPESERTQEQKILSLLFLGSNGDTDIISDITKLTELINDYTKDENSTQKLQSSGNTDWLRFLDAVASQLKREILPLQIHQQKCILPHLAQLVITFREKLKYPPNPNEQNQQPSRQQQRKNIASASTYIQALQLYINNKNNKSLEESEYQQFLKDYINNHKEKYLALLILSNYKLIHFPANITQIDPILTPSHIHHMLLNNNPDKTFPPTFMKDTPTTEEIENILTTLRQIEQTEPKERTDEVKILKALFLNSPITYKLNNHKRLNILKDLINKYNSQAKTQGEETHYHILRLLGDIVTQLQKETDAIKNSNASPVIYQQQELEHLESIYIQIANQKPNGPEANEEKEKPKEQQLKEQQLKEQQLEIAKQHLQKIAEPLRNEIADLNGTQAKVHLHELVKQIHSFFIAYTKKLEEQKREEERKRRKRIEQASQTLIEQLQHIQELMIEAREAKNNLTNNHEKKEEAEIKAKEGKRKEEENKKASYQNEPKKSTLNSNSTENRATKGAESNGHKKNQEIQEPPKGEQVANERNYQTEQNHGFFDDLLEEIVKELSEEDNKQTTKQTQPQPTTTTTTSNTTQNTAITSTKTQPEQKHKYNKELTQTLTQPQQQTPNNNASQQTHIKALQVYVNTKKIKKLEVEEYNKFLISYIKHNIATYLALLIQANYNLLQFPDNIETIDSAINYTSLYKNFATDNCAKIYPYSFMDDTTFTIVIKWKLQDLQQIYKKTTGPLKPAEQILNILFNPAPQGASYETRIESLKEAIKKYKDKRSVETGYSYHNTLLNLGQIAQKLHNEANALPNSTTKQQLNDLATLINKFFKEYAPINGLQVPDNQYTNNTEDIKDNNTKTEEAAEEEMLQKEEKEKPQKEKKARPQKEEKERAEKIEESKEVTNENLNQNKGQDSNLTTTQKIIKNLSATNKMLQNIMQILY